jgi:hypothetical protein
VSHARLLAFALALVVTVVPAHSLPARTADLAEPGLDVILDSTQHWVGTNDVLLTVYEHASGVTLAETGVPLEIRFTAPDGSVLRSEPAVERFATYGRRLYRSRVPLDEVGRWTVDVAAEIEGEIRTGTAVLDVWPDLGTPPLGSRAPGGETPTMRDAHSLMHHISSDPEPLTAFYTWSLDDALAQGQPTVFVLDSYAFRPNAACGGALGILHEVFIDYPGLTIIHAEPWHMAMGPDGHMLELDPPGGPAVLTDYAKAWGITEPPWVFVIDRDGRLRAKFTGVIGSDELRAAITSVTAWRPVGG